MPNGGETPRPTTEDRRRLGDQWEHWDGEVDRDTAAPEASRGVFLGLAVAVVAVFSLAGLAFWYLIHPRLMLIHPWVAVSVAVVLSLLMIAFCGWLLLVMLAANTGKRIFFTYYRMEGSLLVLLPPVIWLAKRVGISRDRVANSFLKVSNAVVRATRPVEMTARPLLLLPRCFDSETRARVREIAERHQWDVFVAGGGEDARRAIRERKPTAIVAVACERDLLSGIQDVAIRVPVLGIPNRRPEGPCKNTTVDLSQLEDAISFVKAPPKA